MYAARYRQLCHAHQNFTHLLVLSKDPENVHEKYSFTVAACQ